MGFEENESAQRMAMRIGLFDATSRHGPLLQTLLTQACYHGTEILTAAQLADRPPGDALDLLIVIGYGQDNQEIESLNQVRQFLSPNVPVLFVGESGGVEAEALALNAGADDYIVYWRSPEVLVARVASLLRRTHRARLGSALECYGPYEIDAIRHVFTLHGNALTLTQREFDLAALLFHHLDSPLSRAQIFESVWHQSFGASSRTVDTHICWLRSKLQLCRENGYLIVAVHGYGYRLETVHSTQAGPTAAA
jgi:DNA-binding response OmpR family regulator